MFPKVKPAKKRIYLDHAATTYVDPSVAKAMESYWTKSFGNPSSLYQEGREAQQAMEDARRSIAGLLGARSSEIIFTAGGTESVNLAIFGVARFCLSSRSKSASRPHLLASAIEHHAVLNSLEALKAEGCEPNVVEVDGNGFIRFDELKAALRPETVLVSVMYANNEIGTVQPIAKIGRWLSEENTKRQARGLPRVLFHTDACQAAGALSMDVNRLGVDLMTVNGSKIYGPKQTGFLYVRTGTDLKPLIYGGGQERNLRSGTENVPGIVGLAKALELAQKTRLKENKRLSGLRNYLYAKIVKAIPDVILNGPEVGKTDDMNRLPNNLNVSFPGVEGEALLLYLDSYGISVSTGSACTSHSPDPSHVLIAIGRSYDEAQSSIRFTLGKRTTRQELDFVTRVLPGIVEELRRKSK